MKHLPFALAMLALACVIAAVWRPDYVWQLSLTAFILIVTAAGFAANRQVQK